MAGHASRSRDEQADRRSGRKIRSRPGAAERIDARTDVLRSVRRLAELREELVNAVHPGKDL